MVALAVAVLAAASVLSSALTPPPAPRAPVAGRQEPAPPAPARIHGRFVDELGAPVEGVELSLRGRPLRTATTSAPSGAVAWQDPPPSSSDANGRFELTFVAAPGHYFNLSATREGRASLEWSWSELRAGAQLALGELELQCAATIVGQIVDPEGGLLIDGWRVMAFPDKVDRAHTGNSFSGRQVQVDPESGSFCIEGLPPGEFRVTAHRGRTQTTNPVRVTTVAGSVAQVELLFSGPPESTLLQVLLQTGAPTSAGPAEGTVWAIAPDGTRTALQRVPEEPRRWSVAAQQDGPYRIVVEDPTFQPAEVEGVVPGAPARLSLTGTAKLMLMVVDPTTGAELDVYGLAVRYRPDDEARKPYEVFPPSARFARPHGPIHLVPGDIELVVWSHDRPQVFVPLGALPAGHARPARVELGLGLSLRGRVVDSAGAPVPGAVVELTQGTRHGHDLATGVAIVQRSSQGGEMTSRVIPRRDHRLVTDGAGSFGVDGIAAGQWAAYVHHGPFVHGTHVVDVQSGSEEEVELVLPAFTEAFVTLANFRPGDPQRFSLSIEGLWPGASPFHPPEHRAHGLGVRPHMDGQFEPFLVPLGRQRLSVLEDRQIARTGTFVSVWESVEDVTPCLELTIDLRREE
jgi:hypothetical protein